MRLSTTERIIALVCVCVLGFAFFCLVMAVLAASE